MSEVLELIIDSPILLQSKINDAAISALSVLNSGSAALITVSAYDEEKTVKRTLPQNNLSVLVYTRIGAVLHGGDFLAARCECKLRVGVFIMRRDNLRFRQAYDSVIRPLDYELKIKAMEFFPVTSLMSKKQKIEYMTQVLNDYTLKGCYFGDINGTDQYSGYKEAQQ